MQKLHYEMVNLVRQKTRASRLKRKKIAIIWNVLSHKRNNRIICTNGEQSLNKKTE